MSVRPGWLPELADVTGSDDEIIRRLYQKFLADFDGGHCRFRGLPVRWDQSPVFGRPCDRGFWHLVSRENTWSGSRELDRGRARHIPWCSAAIKNEQDEAALVWEARERGRLRTYIWIQDWDFVVVLEYRDFGSESGMFLVTAYPVIGDATRRRLRRRMMRGNAL